MKTGEIEDAGSKLIRDAGDGPLSAGDYKALTAKLRDLVKELPKAEQHLIWVELWAEPLFMLSSVGS